MRVALGQPRAPLIAEAKRVFWQAIEHHGGDRYRARHHRRLLLDAGFSRPVAGASLGTVSVFGTNEDTRFIATWLVEQFHDAAFANLVIEQG
ncbi:MAG: hypothetical protein JO020_03910 [Chloroflexi bacterium]|nr:hypothetical protein [Chloroflexota bacterium]